MGAHGAIDAYPFPDAKLQHRYEALIDQLRCPQCLNTNLAGSDAMIAQDLRREVHRLLIAGQSDEEILTFMYERYGDFILYQPRLSVGTFILWFGPVLLLLLATAILLKILLRRRPVTLLTEQEQQRIDDLMNDLPADNKASQDGRVA